MPSEQRYIATFQTGRHYKVHRSYIWIAPLVALVAVIVVAAINGIQGLVQLGRAIEHGYIAANPIVIVVITLAVIVAAFFALVGLHALGWRNMSYVFDEREFSFYSGIITKRRVHVPYARVQSVNHNASISQRIVGVCTVSIESAGGSANKAVRVPYLSLETAERLRAELFSRKAAVAAGVQVQYVPEADSMSETGALHQAEQMRRKRSQAPEAPGFEALGQDAVEANLFDTAAAPVANWRGLYGGATLVDDEPVTYENGLKNHELLLTCLSHDAPIVTASIVGATMLVGMGFMLLVQDEVARFLASFVIPIILISVLLGWVSGLIATAFSYGHFHVRRRGSRIEVDRGVLTRSFSGIDIDRVQSIEVRQSFVRRLLGFCELSLGRIDAAGEQSSGNNNSRMGTKGLVVHPFVKLDQVDAILDELLPEFADRPRISEAKPLPRVVLRRALLRRCVWYNWALWTTIGVAVCWAVLVACVSSNAIPIADPAYRERYLSFMFVSFIVVVVACVALSALFAIGAVLWARHSGYTWDSRYLLVYNDGLSTAQSVLPRQKIQAAQTRDNPFQRRLNLTSLYAITAVGAGATTIRLLDIPAEEGAAYLEWLKPVAKQQPNGN